MMLSIATIQARHDELATRREQAIAQYDALEQQIAELKRQRALLRRNIDGMSGGLQELEGMIAIAQEPTPENNGKTLIFQS